MASASEAKRMAELQRVPARQRGKVVGQVGLGRHFGAIDQNRDHRDVALERRGNLDAHVIVRVVEPALALAVGGGQPMRTDDGKQRVALGDLRVELLDEVEPRLDRIDVDEDFAVREAAREVVVKPAGDAGRIISAVVDKDAGHAGGAVCNMEPIAAQYSPPRGGAKALQSDGPHCSVRGAVIFPHVRYSAPHGSNYQPPCSTMLAWPAPSCT